MEKIVLKAAGTDDFIIRESYKALRTNLQFCGRDIQVIALTSCYSGEGKSTVTMNLALSLAELGKKVLVIDADMRKKVNAGRYIKGKNLAGLSDLLSGMASLKDALHMTQRENLHIIFAGSYPPNPVELVSSRSFASLLEETRRVYDYVLIDTPPLHPVIDAAVIAPLCDGTVLVMGDGMVGSREARNVVSQLKKSGGKILGVVRNRVHLSKPSYYGYGYYHQA